MIFVENPNEYNNEVIKELKDKINVIIHSKKLNLKTNELKFHFVHFDDIERIGSFVVLNRNELDKKIDRKDLFNKIIENYQSRN